jgi:hypothetical protein
MAPQLLWIVWVNVTKINQGKKNMFKNLIILSVLGVALCFVSLTELKSSTASKVNFSDVKEDTKRFIRLNSELKLTPEQERRYKNALSQIPAPCCSDYKALTC